MSESTKQTHGPFADPHWLVYQYHPGCDAEKPGVTLHCVAAPTQEHLDNPSVSLLKMNPGHEVESEITADENGKFHVHFKQSPSDAKALDAPSAMGVCSKVCGGVHQSTFDCPTGDKPACDSSGHLICEA